MSHGITPETIRAGASGFLKLVRVLPSAEARDTMAMIHSAVTTAKDWTPDEIEQLAFAYLDHIEEGGDRFELRTFVQLTEIKRALLLDYDAIFQWCKSEAVFTRKQEGGASDV